MVKKALSSFLLLSMMFVLAVSVSTAQDETLQITYVVNGVLGDKSFFDSGQRGVDLAMDEFDVDVNTVELGVDPANWETGLDDAMADTDAYEVMIVGTFQMVEFLSRRAHLYPDKVFILFDAPAFFDDPSICVDACANVYSVTYKQNEGSFLAGVYAQAMSLSEVEGFNEATVVGAIGGQDIPVINDFIAGYEQGACLVNPDSQLLVQYAGGWNDPARGKEIALAMYEQNADIVFQIAGGTGEGVFEAAAERSRFAIGVDSDQALIIQDTAPERADRILTSMLKNVDNSIYRAIDLYLQGELLIGQNEALGIAEGGVGLAYNDIYFDGTPEDVQELIAAVEAAVVDGDIIVNTVFAEEGEAAVVGQGCAAMPETDFDVSAYLMQ